MVDTFSSKPGNTTEENQAARAELRQNLRVVRDNLSTSQVQGWSESVCSRLLPLLGDARRIGGYLALGNELNLAVLATTLQNSHRQYYVPIIRDQHQMVFARLDADVPLVANRFGIKEPRANNNNLSTGLELDLIFVPLVGFDKQCNRLGMGGGFYDRCFEQRKQHAPPPRLVGVAYECQYADSVFPCSWDVPLDAVVTEARIIKRSGVRH